MKLDYQDISAIVEFIILKAEKEDILITTIDELHNYLDENYSEFINFENED